MMASTAFIFLIAASVSTALGCSTECCQTGGTCGDPVFDNCLGGRWDYSLSCSPSYRTCCIPNAPIATTTKAPVDQTRETTRATNPPPTDNGRTTPRPVTAPQPSACGQLSSPRIVGGAPAQARWPWMAQLERDYFGWGGWEHFCGAALISDRWAVSAAHCVAKYNEADPGMFRVVLGEHDRSIQEGTEVIKPVSRIIVHGAWSADVRGSPSDVALLELASPVSFNEHITPACLPEYTDQQFYPEDDCWIMGWGDTKGTGNNNILQEVKISITPYDECRQKWLTGTGGKDYVKTSHVCVGNGVPGACNGDSGGPLVCRRDGRFILVGATSFGAAGCQETDAPNVYTRLSHFLPWILDNMMQ